MLATVILVSASTDFIAGQAWAKTTEPARAAAAASILIMGFSLQGCDTKA